MQGEGTTGGYSLILGGNVGDGGGGDEERKLHGRLIGLSELGRKEMRGEGDLFIKWSSLGAFRFPLWACLARSGAGGRYGARAGLPLPTAHLAHHFCSSPSKPKRGDLLWDKRWAALLCLARSSVRGLRRGGQEGTQGTGRGRGTAAKQRKTKGLVPRCRV